MRLFARYLVILIILAPGCAALKPPVEPRKALPPPLTLRATASVEIERSVVLSGRAVVLAKSPGAFRIEVQGPFGSVMALLVSDGRTIYLLSGVKSKRYLRDDPRIPYSLKPEEAVSFLLGSRMSAAQCGCEVSKDAYGRASKVIKSADGSPGLTATLSDYRTVKGAEVPFDIKIANKKEVLHIKYTSVEVNPELEAGSFDTEGLP